jgi:hypothetical protein
VPNTIGRLQPSQYYQASGEATPQAKLPEKFQSFNRPNSPLSTPLDMPYMSWHDISRANFVDRHERTIGMRTGYWRRMTQMPIQRLGADGQPIPWDSAANRNDMGPIRNTHNNDALYQAGYPGYNLGLSFKVQNINAINAASGQRSIDNTPANINVSNNTPILQRAISGIKGKWGRSAGSS